MERAEPQLSSSLGRITISTGAIGQIVSQTAARCYGVVEIGGGARAKVGRLLPRSRGTPGIAVSGEGDSASAEEEEAPQDAAEEVAREEEPEPAVVSG